MIGRLKGILLEKQPPEILLDVQGVGYELLLPMTSFYDLPEIGQETTLFTHLVVREDAHLLFGFAQKTDRTLFRELIKTNGVGPKLALAILSAMSVEQFAYAIEREELSKLVKIPGVGKVTSERLLKMGLETCEDVQKLDQSILLNIFGKMGKRIWDFSHGIDEREIQAHRERKSIGVERTLSENIRHIEQGIALLDNLYVELIRRIERSAPNIPLTAFRKIGVKLKFEDFQVTTLEKTGLPLSLKSFQQLLEQIWQRSHGKSIRLVGLHVTLPEESHLEQMSLW